MKPTLLLTAIALFNFCLAHAAPPANLVRAELLADASTIAPGSSFTLGVKLQIKPQWHVYWANPGETGTATQITPGGPAGFIFGPIQWPIPAKLNTEAGLSYAYENEVLLLIPVTIGKEAAAGEVTLTTDVKWLACHDTCIEGKAALSMKLNIAPATKPENQELFATWRARLPILQDTATARKLLTRLEQPFSKPDRPGDVTFPLSAFTITWNNPPAKIDWYPLATRAVMIEDVKVEQAGATSTITFKPTVYKPMEVPGGIVNGILVYEDSKGNRQGVFAPVHVLLSK